MKLRFPRKPLSGEGGYDSMSEANTSYPLYQKNLPSEKSMKNLLKYFKGYAPEAFSAPFFKILEACFELLVPFVVAAIIDNGVPSGDRLYILRMCGVLVLLGAVGLASTLAAQYFAAKGAVGFCTNLRRALFEHIESLSFSELDSLGSSALITRLTSDINTVQSGLNMMLRLMMRSPIIVFGAMIMAFTIDFKAALIFVLTIPVLTAVVVGITLKCIPLYSSVQKKLERVLLLTKENLTGSRVIRAFCKEESETARFKDGSRDLCRSQKLVGRISAAMNPLTFVIINLSIIALIYRGALSVQAGALTQGLVIALYNYMSQILVELIKLANLIISVPKTAACLRRVTEVLNTDSSQQNGTATECNINSEYSVEYINCSLRYKGAGADSLENISLKLKPGETLGIIGPTGCGKSSLASLPPRFYDVREGEVRVFGRNVKDYNLTYLRSLFGFVLQKNRLFKGTIRSNMKLGAENATDEEIIEALKAAQAWEFVSELPDGLDHVIEQGQSNLSGGQAQRFCIARALVRKPKILVLDDSSSALDFRTDSRLRAAVGALDYRPTVMIVSQRVSTVMHCDRIVVLEDGAAVGIGSHEELLKSCPDYAEIYKSQIKAAEGGESA